ncbi:F-box protein At2g05970 [Vigna umbellata]|uniref:F-box protein At2g05970 n=1 Tax=Vigna umbellata TaxID=87088 RepID=UPI001F5FBAD9|nr:F-box protein At2g05970 [Vigna umbellata]XP_047160880.1 F-box protein At2g05970 [Vigna umbellata]XP_047160881.1 F-box protein At2g05970 [Vigna umbellata]
MRSLLLAATITKVSAKRMKRRCKKRKLSKKCHEDLSSIPSLLLETIRRRYSAKCSKKIRKRKRELEKECYADWSSLPRGILEMIAEKLTFIDCLSISKVCMSWNVILGEELPSWQRHGFPCLLVSGQQNKETRTCISILENRVWELELAEARGKYCWGSFRGWLIMVKNLDYFYLEVSLLNPFSGSQFSLPSVWNFYHKIVPSGLPIENNFVCMLLHSQCRELAFWVTGANSWRKYNKLTGEPFEDAVFCNGSFYLLADGFNVWQIDVQSIYTNINKGNDDFGTLSEIETRFHEVKRPEMFELQERRILQNRQTNQILRYLVESCGELLLVCRYFSPNQQAVLETQKFEVFALDFCQLSWKKVEDLGDQMIFLGKCCSTSFSAKELGVGIRNSIYFCNDPTIPWWNEWDSDHLKGISSRLGFSMTNVNNWGNFSLGNEEGEPFCFHGDIASWAYTWFTVPSWWCYRNIPPIRRN